MRRAVANDPSLGRILTLPPHGTGWRRPRRRSKAVRRAMRTSPPRSPSQTGAVSRCARPRRNAAHGDSPRWSGAEPWVIPPHDTSPQRGERGPLAPCSVCPFRAQRTLCGVIPGVPPRAFICCPFGARGRYAPGLQSGFWELSFHSLLTSSATLRILGSGNWKLPHSTGPADAPGNRDGVAGTRAILPSTRVGPAGRVRRRDGQRLRRRSR